MLYPLSYGGGVVGAPWARTGCWWAALDRVADVGAGVGTGRAPKALGAFGAREGAARVVPGGAGRVRSLSGWGVL